MCRVLLLPGQLCSAAKWCNHVVIEGMLGILAAIQACAEASNGLTG